MQKIIYTYTIHWVGHGGGTDGRGFLLRCIKDDLNSKLTYHSWWLDEIDAKPTITWGYCGQ